MTTKSPVQHITPSRLLAAVLASAAVFILAVLVYRQRGTLASHPWQLRWDYALAGLLIFFVNMLLAARVWGWIMNALSDEVSYLSHLRNYSLSNIAKRLPGTLWYLPSRFFFYKKEGIPIKNVTVASGIEIAITLAAGITCTFLFISPLLMRHSFGLVGLVAGLGLMGMAVHPRIVQWFIRKAGIQGKPQLGYGKLTKCFGVMILVWILGGSELFLIGNSITAIDFRHIPYLIGSWTLIGTISTGFFFWPSYFGIAELSLGLLLSNIIPSPVAIVLVIFARICLTVYELIWASGIFWLLKSQHQRLP